MHHVYVTSVAKGLKEHEDKGRILSFLQTFVTINEKLLKLPWLTASCPAGRDSEESINGQTSDETT